MVRIFHTSDTHLGHQQYPRTAPSGLNQREQDHTDTWDHLVGLACQEKPDLFVHAGDLFDGVRPSNRALATALEGFLRLGQAGVHVVVIAGNHETPRLRETGSPFRLFDHLPNVHAVYKGRRESIVIQTGGGPITVHAVPQCPSEEALQQEVAGAERGDGANLLVLHGTVHSLPAFRHAEFNELTLHLDWFDDRFDYVALGHHHGAQEVTSRSWYCGAPDRVSMAEAGEPKGFLDVQVEPGATPEVAFRELAGRPYMDLPAVTAGGLGADAIAVAAIAALERAPDGSVARLRINDLDPSLRGQLPLDAIRQAAARLLHLDLRLEWADISLRVKGAPELRGLSEEFEAYAAQHPIEGLDRERLLALARASLEAA
ncbi:MAG: metallophosphoesterase family protein [Thermoplasmatota archaeon]